MIDLFLLKALSRPIESADYPSAKTTAKLGDSLKLLKTEFPGLKAMVQGRRVLDFGCGIGRQSIAMATEMNALMTGLDTNRGALKKALTLAAEHELSPQQCNFVTKTDGQYDVIISQNAMEHFPEPEAILALMKSKLSPGGKLLITFSPPWLSPYGSHMHFFCKVPWVHILFREKTVMAVRNLYRNDGARRYTEVASGLNKMTVNKFERLVRQSGFQVSSCHYRGVKGFKLFTRIPLLRELLTNRVTCTLVHSS